MLICGIKELFLDYKSLLFKIFIYISSSVINYKDCYIIDVDFNSVYYLIIYYQNVKSYNVGMITALSNRIGNVALVLSIA
ncbi:NADH-ubiquinone oxidoreductase chain 5 [Gryllus bimaculatus]|nr:NADH-ubiquinone oxidoreductase chain 5 [Gryllus bimaculatus]